MNLHVVLAVFRRNFAGYFSSPIGYVFICAFVLLTGFAAFWTQDFFNTNLATLDQLNRHLPWIMLVFIPAIAMNIWADERRQGTDELVLTLPATDFDVVLGKYLAALAIFSVSLLFSLSNIFVLAGLGKPDIGLLIGNYVGYWFVGAAMLAVGMVASFLTSSLAVAFVLALAFNAPLVFAAWADAIVPWESISRLIKGASIAQQFTDFGKGLITLSGAVFFLSIIAVSLYVSMALMTRRHWAGGPYAKSMAVHYVLRTVALIAVAVGVNVLVARIDLRIDASHERVNSLSARTKDMLGSLDTERPVYVEAYISPDVPEEYVPTRLNLLAMLREIKARGGDRVVVKVHDTPRFSAAEEQAQNQYGIQAQSVRTSQGGKFAMQDIVMGAAFTCGLDKVVVPFFDKGMPVEYELVRSIATVSLQQRKRIGVLSTEAQLYGGFDMNTMSSRPSQLIVDELRKQYEVVQVNADSPITERYDALLAVQPSSLTPGQMDNFIAAVHSGQPTLIFEDPLPVAFNVTPTSQERRPPNQNPFMQQPPPEPKGNIAVLWNLLGVRFHDLEIVWQDWNPYQKIEQFRANREIVFIGEGSGAAEPFAAASPITSGLQQVVALFAGYIDPLQGSTLTFQPLIRTGTRTGTVLFDDLMERNPDKSSRSTQQTYVLAARITGQVPAGPPTPADTQPQPSSINVVLVADIDILSSEFFTLRSRGQDDLDPVAFNFDNVTFALNALDAVAGDERFMDIRKRRPAYRTLTTVEARTADARTRAQQQREEFITQFDTKRDEEQKRLDDRLAELRNRTDIDAQELLKQVAIAQQTGQNRLNAAIAQLEKQRDAELKVIERREAMEIRAIQDRYKLLAIAFPPILPLALAAFVYQRRRSMENIGIPKSRMR